MNRYVIFVSLAFAFSATAQQPTTRERQLSQAEKIKLLEDENAQLREMVRQLEAKLSANGDIARNMADAVKMTQTDIDRANNSMLQLLQDQTVCRVTVNGVNIVVVMNSQKWNGLTKDQRAEFLNAVVGWSKTQVDAPLHSRIDVRIIANDAMMIFANYRGGRVRFIN
jgi:TRAP-type C4-dicarboxylate transport system substrate-binding protein